RGHWCSRCAIKRNSEAQKLSIEEMHELAKSKGGKCLSEKYDTARTKLLWKCKYGHHWHATPDAVKRISWCPYCSQGISERVCRKYFESLFGKNFPKVRPKWLVAPSEKTLELDGYCKELKLAFEYQGKQHYKHINHFSREMSFERRIEYDKLKKKMCRLNGVVLIEIPYKIKFENMGKYIVNQCEKNSIDVPNRDVKFDSFKFYYPEQIKELQEIASSRGGKLLSTNYVNSETKLEWKCKYGHIWMAIPASIRIGRWCPRCACRGPSARLSIEDMQKIAKDRGGECLSSEYKNARTNLKWRCKEGHVWMAIPDNVKNKEQWCQKCYYNRRKTSSRTR
ncbi:MAG: hypothetical protein NT120_04685, partial [Candidatus Aenigmarchaeota archaeon]|nr:hypothetical protein [Candidatus Aenigmarchaeota archaeon]